MLRRLAAVSLDFWRRRKLKELRRSPFLLSVVPGNADIAEGGEQERTGRHEIEGLVSLARIDDGWTSRQLLAQPTDGKRNLKRARPLGKEILVEIFCTATRFALAGDEKDS